MTNYAPTAFSREIISRIRGLIARFDVNQADLAILCDVSQSQFSKIIRGARPMTIDQLAAICDALDIDLGELATEVQTFVDDRDMHAAPIRYVSEEERVPEPEAFLGQHLDEWAIAARDRIGTADDNVIAGRFGVGASTEDDLGAVAKTKGRDRGGDDGEG